MYITILAARGFAPFSTIVEYDGVPLAIGRVSASGPRAIEVIVNASDKRKTLIRILSYARQHASMRWCAEKGWNMPALKEISFEYARQIASVKGLQPSKVRGTSTLRFTKNSSDKLQVITWDEFVRTANGRNLAVYESGGWMKLMRKH